MQDGFITIEELASALNEPLDLIRQYIHEYDLNKDGTIDFKVRDVVLGDALFKVSSCFTVFP